MLPSDEAAWVAEILSATVRDELAALREQVENLTAQAANNDVIVVLRAGPATVLFWSAVGVLVGAVTTGGLYFFL